MPSYANNHGTVAANMYNAGIQSLVDLGNKYSDNESIGGLVAGSLADSFRTQASTGQALAYNDAFLGSMANYQGGMENLKTGNTMKLMAAEGEIATNLMDTQGGWQIKGIKETGKEQRLGMQTKGQQDRLGIQTTGAQQRLGLETAGSEERKNISSRMTQELRARADARGAVTRAGSRFYG